METNYIGDNCQCACSQIRHYANVFIVLFDSICQQQLASFKIETKFLCFNGSVCFFCFVFLFACVMIFFIFVKDIQMIKLMKVAVQ